MQARSGVSAIHDVANRIIDEVEKVIVGKREVVQHTVIAVLCEGHVLLEDVPGLGKTMLARSLAAALGGDFSRVQFTPDLLPTDITGSLVFDPRTSEFSYREGPIVTNVLLADEINRAGPRTQSALLEAMEERQVTVDGKTRPLPRPFLVLATENPVGSAGTQMLPASQLDRFLIRLSMGYPDRNSQVALMRDRHSENPLDGCRTVGDGEALQRLSAEAMNVYVSDGVYGYIADLAEATRKDPDVALGLSPRGALALCRAAKANAYLEGRDYATPEDVAALLENVAGHRLVLGAKARLRERTAESVLQDILRTVPKPGVKEWKL